MHADDEKWIAGSLRIAPFEGARWCLRGEAEEAGDCFMDLETWRRSNKGRRDDCRRCAGAAIAGLRRSDWRVADDFRVQAHQ